MWYGFTMDVYKIDEARKAVYILEDSKTLCVITSLPFSVENDIFITVNQSLPALVKENESNLDRYQRIYPLGSVETCYFDEKSVYLTIPNEVSTRVCYTEAVFVFACFFTSIFFASLGLTYGYFKFYKSKERFVVFIFKQLSAEERLLNHKNQFSGFEIGGENHHFDTFEIKDVLTKIYLLV